MRPGSLSEFLTRIRLRYVASENPNVSADGASPRAFRLAAVWRRCAESSTFRRRTLPGVTSTHSSWRMYSSAWSSESGRGGMRRTVSSALGARMFDSFFSFDALTSIPGTRVFTDDHPFVDVNSRTDEERPALLQVENGKGSGLAAAICDERARRSGAELANPRLEAVEDVVEDPGAARLREELGAEADQPARGDDDVHPHPARPVVDERFRWPLRSAKSCVTTPR